MPNPPTLAPPDERRAIAFGLLAVLLWSTVATGFKLGLAHLAPQQLLLLGSVISFVFFASYTIVTGRAHEVLASRGRPLALALGLGLLNPFLYYLLLFEAYRRLPAQIAQPLNYTWAVTMALLAVPLLRQRLSRRDVAGIVVSYAGVAVLLSQGGAADAPLDLFGVALALASTLVWAGYWLAAVRLPLPPAVAMTAGFATGTVAIAAFCAFTTGLPRVTWIEIGYGAWVGLVEMGVTFLLWREALGRTAHAARLAQLIFLSPFLSFVLIAAFVGEAIHPASVVGLAAIVAGLVISRRAPA